MGDSTAIWFVQVSQGGELRWIGYHEAGSVGLKSYAGILAGKGCVYARQILPHDV